MTRITGNCMIIDYRGFFIVALEYRHVVSVLRDDTLICCAHSVAQARTLIDGFADAHARDSAVMNDGVVGSVLGARKSAFIGLSRKAPAFEHGVATEAQS